MSKSIRNVLLAGTIAASTAFSIAWAQTPPAATPGQPGQMRAQRMAEMCRELPALRASRLAYLEVKLALSEAQKPAWTTYSQDMRAAGEPMRRLCDNPPKAETDNDAAAMLANRERFLAAMLENTRLARAATEKLQAVLTPEQKTVLAEVTRRWAMRGMARPHHHMHGGHGGHGGMHGHGGSAPAGSPPPR